MCICVFEIITNVWNFILDDLFSLNVGMSDSQCFDVLVIQSGLRIDKEKEDRQKLKSQQTQSGNPP